MWRDAFTPLGNRTRAADAVVKSVVKKRPQQGAGWTAPLLLSKKTISHQFISTVYVSTGPCVSPAGVQLGKHGQNQWCWTFADGNQMVLH